MTLTTAQARDRTRAEIVFLVEVQTLASGPLLLLSDRNITIAGIQYADYIASVTGLGDQLTRATGAFANGNASIVFKNDPWDANAYLSDLLETYPFEGAAVTIKRVFVDDDGTTATPETVFVGNLDSPVNISTIAFTCSANCREMFASLTNR